MHGGKSLCNVWSPQKVVSVDRVAPYVWEGGLAMDFSVILPKKSIFQAKIEFFDFFFRNPTRTVSERLKHPLNFPNLFFHAFIDRIDFCEVKSEKVKKS